MNNHGYYHWDFYSIIARNLFYPVVDTKKYPGKTKNANKNRYSCAYGANYHRINAWGCNYI